MSIPRPCDFCGDVPTLATVRWPRGSRGVVWRIQCTHCGAGGPMHTDMNEAERMWNEGKWDKPVAWDKEYEQQAAAGNVTPWPA